MANNNDITYPCWSIRIGDEGGFGALVERFKIGQEEDMHKKLEHINKHIGDYVDIGYDDDVVEFNVYIELNEILFDLCSNHIISLKKDEEEEEDEEDEEEEDFGGHDIGYCECDDCMKIQKILEEEDDEDEEEEDSEDEEEEEDEEKDLRKWLKEQILAIERGELDDEKRMLIVELMDSSTGDKRKWIESILAEAQSEL